MNEINRNFAWCNDYSDKSFLGILHEEYIWSDIEYLKLEDNLFELSAEFKDSSLFPREVVWPVMRIFSYSMLLLGCHFNPNDGFEIKNINSEDITERTERLQVMFEGFFQGTMPDKDDFSYTNSVKQ